MAFLGIKNSNERVGQWAASHTFLPGCDGSLTAKCTFNGTAADWENFRRNSIDNCMAENSGGFLQSKNKTRNSCQAAFDAQTQSVQMTFAAQNLQDKNYIQSLIGQDNPMLYLGAFFFVAFIVYLLFSK